MRILLATLVLAALVTPAAAKEPDDRPAEVWIRGVTLKHATDALTLVMSENACTPVEVNAILAVYDKHADLTRAAIAGAIAGMPSGAVAKHRLTFTIDEGDDGAILIQNARVELIVNDGSPNAYRQDLTKESRKSVQELLKKAAKAAKQAVRREAKEAEAKVKEEAEKAKQAAADSAKAAKDD